MRSAYHYLLLFLLASGLYSCTNKPEPQQQHDTATSGSFELMADETLRPAIDSLVESFDRKMPQAHITVRYTNAVEALDRVLQGKARLAIIARPISTNERHQLESQNITLPEFDIALNGIAVIAARNSPLRTISLDSLRAMTRGSLDLKYYSTSYLSSTETTLDSVFGFPDSTLKGRITRYQTSDSVITAVRSDPHALGFIGSAWWHTCTNDSTLKDIRISSAKSSQPIQLHLAYLYEGLYPLASRVCGYTNEPPNTLPRGFLAFAMTADGQRIFLHFDVLPRTQIIRLVPPK